MQNQKKLVAIAVGLLVIVAIAMTAQFRRGGGQAPITSSPQDVAKEIQRIESDPNMPEQAKRMAIQQMRARSGGAGAPPTTR